MVCLRNELYNEEDEITEVMRKDVYMHGKWRGRSNEVFRDTTG